MNAIFLSDLHLTDRSSDEHRWRLFEWLIGMCNKVPESFHYLFLLGDLTDRKNFHSAALTNRVVDALVDTRQRCGFAQIVVLRANHDGLDPDCAFFRFLRHIPGIRFVSQPEYGEFAGCSVLMLPHSRNPENDWKEVDFHDPELILMHQTMQGSVSESGMKLSGLSQDIFGRGCRATIYSGDIHQPQKVGRVEYVGAPYPVRFGDSYEPRTIVWINDRRQPDWLIPGPRKHVVEVRDPIDEQIEQLGLIPECDHVKVRLHLSRSEYGNWQHYKEKVQEICLLQHLDLFGIELVKKERPTVRKAVGKDSEKIDPADAVRRFGKSQKLDFQTVETGVELLPED